MRKRSPGELLSERPLLVTLKQKQRLPVCAIVDNIRSLHNIGAIFRIADGFLLEKLFLCGIAGVPPRNEIRKTSLGAEDIVPWEYYNSAAEVVRKLKSAGYEVIALEQTDSSTDLGTSRFRFPMGLIVGHEQHGISDEVIQLVDRAVEIPLHGIKSSLNVSVAFGIAVFQAVQQYLNEVNTK